MSKNRIYFYVSLTLLVLLTGLFFPFHKKNDTFSEVAKVALRDVGNQLLLVNRDSTSLVLPIEKLSKHKYRLSFETQLVVEPSQFVAIVEKSFQKLTLPENYSVEVTQCETNEVAYSYIMSARIDSTIIPCKGRVLPRECYLIDVRFTNPDTPVFGTTSRLIVLALFIGFIGFLDVVRHKRKRLELEPITNGKFKLGSFQFYPEQNKLVKSAVEISLSKKECELLAIFVENPNQIIKRDELTKRVWEDNGVFVGRSLDTYISKLRKKLKDDDSIKLSNVHGVGYKLEISSNSKKAF